MNNTFFLNLWVTHSCNLACRYCYAKDSMNNKVLTKETADEVLNFLQDQVKEAENVIINFHGGEPLLAYDLIQYIITSCELLFSNISFGMTTNGLLLTPENINYLSEKLEYNFSISLDGSIRTHMFNRPSKAEVDYYEHVLKMSKLVLALNKNVRIRMTYDRHNIKALAENIIYFIEMGFKYIIPVADSYSNEWQNSDFELIKSQYIILSEYLGEHYINDIKFDTLNGQLKEMPRCDGGEDYYSIDTDGSIYPCIMVVGDKQHKIGDVFLGLTKENLVIINKVKNEEVDSCQTCVAKKYCICNRCVMVNYSINNSYNRVDTVSCMMMHVRLQLIEEGYSIG